MTLACRILDELEIADQLTAADLAQRLGVDVGAVYSALVPLEARAIVVMEPMRGARKRRAWAIRGGRPQASRAPAPRDLWQPRDGL